VKATRKCTSIQWTSNCAKRQLDDGRVVVASPRTVATDSPSSTLSARASLALVTPGGFSLHAQGIANNTAYGLTDYIQTEDQRRIRRLIPRLRAGTIGVNTGACVHHSAPFGGVGISGFGREGGKAGIEEFIRVKTILQK
jgi:Aldehyde dehydrogenase family